MAGDGIELISKHVCLLDTIRLNKGLDISGVAQELGMTWPTINSYIKELTGARVLCKDEDSNVLSVNRDYGVFFGVSVGSAQIKVCAVDMDFKMLNNGNFQSLISGSSLSSKEEFNPPKDEKIKNYVWVSTPNNRQDLVTIINKIFAAIKYIVEKRRLYRVLGIGVAITGAINCKQKKIIKAFNLNGMDETDFETDILLRNYLDFFEMQGINIAIENNSVAAGVAEKWSLYDEVNLHGEYNINQRYKDCKNIVTVYLGAGFGLSIIQDGKVYRGGNGLGGGIGHLEVPNYSGKEINKDERCTCGGLNCLDNRVRRDVFKMDFESFKKEDSDAIKKYFEEEMAKDKERKDEAKENKDILMGKYLGYVTNLLNNLLNPEVIIISGKLYKAIDELWLAVQMKKSENNLKYTNSNCAIIKSQLGPLAAPIGAAICAYYSRYGADIEW